MANPPDNDQNQKPDANKPERNLANPATTRPVTPAAGRKDKTVQTRPAGMDRQTLSTQNLADKAKEATSNLADTASHTGAAASSAGTSALRKAQDLKDSTLNNTTATRDTQTPPPIPGRIGNPQGNMAPPPATNQGDGAGLLRTRGTLPPPRAIPPRESVSSRGDNPAPGRIPTRDAPPPPRSTQPKRTAPPRQAPTARGAAPASGRLQTRGAVPPPRSTQAQPPLPPRASATRTATPPPGRVPTRDTAPVTRPESTAKPQNIPPSRPTTARNATPPPVPGKLKDTPPPVPAVTKGVVPDPATIPTPANLAAKASGSRPNPQGQRPDDRPRQQARGDRRPPPRDARPPVRRGRPVDDRPRRPSAGPGRRPDMRPRSNQGDRPVAAYRDAPRPRRTMAPPPGAAGKGRFVGHRPSRIAAPVSHTPEGSAWGPLLFGVLLLGGVGWYAVNHYTPQIQEDLLRRSGNALDEAGYGEQASVRIDGRNLILDGNVATESDSEKAAAAVAGTFGVRAVDNRLRIGKLSSPADIVRSSPSLNINLDGESVALAGTVSDQKFADAIKSAAIEQWGADNISGDINVDETTTNPGWISSVSQVLPELGNLENGAIAIGDGTLTLTGSTGDAAIKDSIGSKAEQLLAGQLAVKNQITAPEPAPSEPVTPPAPEPTPAPAPEPAPEPATATTQQRVIAPPPPPPAPQPGVMAEAPAVEAETPIPPAAPPKLPAFASVTTSDNEIIIAGFMSQEGANAVNDAFQGSGKTIINNISINDNAESPTWIAPLSQSIVAVENVSNAKVTMARSGNVTLQGTVDSEALKQSATESVSGVFGEDHPIINNIVVELPPVVPTMSPFAAVIESDDKISISGLMPKDAARALLRTYRKGDKYVADNIAIDERVKAPVWTDSLGKSLESLPNITDRRINISSSGALTVSGLAQSEEDQQTAVANLATLFGDSVSLLNEISVEKPKLPEVPKPDLAALLADINLAGIRFGSNSSEINNETIAILDRVADVLSQDESASIEIAGHTDSSGSAEYNLELSATRAETVMQYLISRGISSNRMSATGFGPARPIATNDTRTGRAQNRRIEITLTGE